MGGVIGVVGLMAVWVLGGAVEPLNESQLVRLGDVADTSGSIDEAGMYALLENAASWEGDVEAGAAVLDYGGALGAPEEWRGRLCLVEGVLWRVVEPSLGRSGWEGVRGLVVEMAGGGGVDTEDAGDSGRRYVMVYLTDPPEIGLRDEAAGLPWVMGAEVRVVGRFYKVMLSETERSGVAGLPVFVGRGVTRLGAVGSGGGGLLGSGAGVLVVTVVVLVALGYAAYRLHSIVRGLGGGERAARKRALDRKRLANESDPVAREEGLPSDPAEALGVLADRAKHRDSGGVG